jgi:hypothetical protein
VSNNLQRDSRNAFFCEFLNGTTDTPLDISLFQMTWEFYQNGVTETLSMGDGLSFQTDGTDGALNILLSKARTNKFCPGVIRIRVFKNLSGHDPEVFAEGDCTLEGKKFNA